MHAALRYIGKQFCVCVCIQNASSFLSAEMHLPIKHKFALGLDIFIVIAMGNVSPRAQTPESSLPAMHTASEFNVSQTQNTLLLDKLSTSILSEGYRAVHALAPPTSLCSV